MNITIVGAGAIGGWLGATFAAAGHDIRFLARGETLEHLRRHGVGLSQEKRDAAVQYYPCKASDLPHELGVSDVLIITVKAQALPAIAPSLKAMIGPATLILPMQNGVPFWFMGAQFPLPSTDPGGFIAQSIPHDQIIGCVIHAAVSSSQKGISHLHFSDKIILGEPSGSMTARLQKLHELFQGAGIGCISSDTIRTDIWYKLWGNLTMNPMSALTLATTDRLLDDPYVREFAALAMEEARTIGRAIGCSIQQTVDDRIATTQKLGAFKTSMLQDVEAGRDLELNALLAAPIEIARHLGLDVPILRGLFGLARVLGRSRGLY